MNPKHFNSSTNQNVNMILLAGQPVIAQEEQSVAQNIRLISICLSSVGAFFLLVMIFSVFYLSNSSRDRDSEETSSELLIEKYLVCQQCANLKVPGSVNNGKVYVSCSTQCDPVVDMSSQVRDLDAVPNPLPWPEPQSLSSISARNTDIIHSYDRMGPPSGAQSSQEFNRHAQHGLVDRTTEHAKDSRVKDLASKNRRAHNSDMKGLHHDEINPNGEDRKEVPSEIDPTSPRRIKIVKQGINIKGVIKLPPISK